jgi:flagellar M-ring protein FliF
MPERIQNILNRIRDWWQKFTVRQKAILISSVSVVIIALIILGVVVTRPKWVVLKVTDDAKSAESIKSLLEDNKITYDFSQTSGNYTFKIHESDSDQASLLLGTNNISTQNYTLDTALSGSLATTEADKSKKYRAYLESEFEQEFSKMKGISDVSVNINIPNDDGTIIASKEDASAGVMVTFMEGDYDKKQIAKGIANMLKANLNKKSFDNINVTDNEGVVLYSGLEENSDISTASSNQEYKAEAEKKWSNKVKTILASNNADISPIYDNVNVAVNLSVDFSKEQSTDYKYYVADGQQQGYLDSHSETSSSSDGGTGGEPGTGSNSNDTTYVTPDTGTTHTESSSSNDDYLPNEIITKKDGEVGKVDVTNSSVAITATTIVKYDEDEMTKNGQLKGTTFDKFRAKNSATKQIKVNKDIKDAVSKATGISSDNITILAYQVPMFIASKSGRTLTDYIQIIIALLVFALLGFVVFRSLRSEKEEEVEEEVSVEDLLADQNSRVEENLEDIGFNEKSEARLLIEKFVDENPEAVANLLRNWLNEDWG